MRDLTEALLIEMERRADHLSEALEEDPNKMSRNEIEEAYDEAYEASQAVAKDVAELCEQLRARVTA